MLFKTFMEAPFAMKGSQGARGFLPDDVRLMSARKECCSIEINDPGIEMVLDAFFFGPWTLQT
jgi:two-component system OmpR family response regulator